MRNVPFPPRFFISVRVMPYSFWRELRLFWFFFSKYREFGESRFARIQSVETWRAAPPQLEGYMVLPPCGNILAASSAFLTCYREEDENKSLSLPRKRKGKVLSWKKATGLTLCVNSNNKSQSILRIRLKVVNLFRKAIVPSQCQLTETAVPANWNSSTS